MIPHVLQQDACHLRTIDQNIIRPFKGQIQIIGTKVGERLAKGNTGQERQAGAGVKRAIRS